MTSRQQQAASSIADQWGPALTKAIVDKDISEFRSLFADDEAGVVVVLQNAEGSEAVFTIVDSKEEGGEEEAATDNPVLEGRVAGSLTWEEFREASAVDLEKQSYAKTEALCLGVLGDRMMMEVGRFNTSGQIIVETYSLLTFNSEGKVTMVETFTDPQVSSVVDKAASASASASSSGTVSEN
jgi:hypothetical protein